MRNSPTVDRPSFQNVLASAFALQQSHMDRESLVDIVELERSVTGSDHDLDEPVHPFGTNTRNLVATPDNVAGVPQVQLPFPELEEDERNSGAFLSNLASTLSASKAEAASADAALDLSLNGIAQQACVATNASAAVIALKLGEEMVCRACSGQNALELYRLLDAVAEPITGTYVREIQSCVDAESDSRIDYLEAEHLGIRSFLIFPVLRADDLVGLLEVFSPRPRAFDDRAIQTLNELSHQVSVHVDCAIEFSAGGLSTTAGTKDTSSPVAVESGILQEKNTVEPRKLQLPFLAFFGIAFTVLGCLMLGRVTWRNLAHTGDSPSTVSTRVGTAPQKTQDDSQAQPAPSPPQFKHHSPKAAGRLEIYRDGQPVFPLKPVRSGNEERDPKAASDKARTRLLRTVPPEYPEAARREHIEGAVILEAQVGLGGQVEQLAVISGNTILASAASRAVLRWRFKPLSQNGSAVPFQIRIRVNFVLP